jgi:repressor of nif and glnA expression
MAEERKTYYEEFKTTGKDLLVKVKELLHEGNIRRLIIRNDEGKNIIEVPLNAGMVGIVLVPKLAALIAVVSLVKDYSIIVEKAEGQSQSQG